MLTKEFKAGLLTLVAGILLYFGFNYLKGLNVFSSRATFYVVYEHVNGLQVSNNVMLNGLTVGRVAAINILQDRQNAMQVTLDLRGEVKIGKNTVAVLSDAGVLGGKFIDLTDAYGTEFISPGQTIPGRVNGGLTEMMKERAEPFLAQLDSVISSVNTLTREYHGSSQKVNEILEQTAIASRQLTAMISNSRGNFEQMMANMNRVSASLVTVEKQLPEIVSKLNAAADSLQKAPLKSTVEETQRSIVQLRRTLEAINQQEGSLGKLLYNDSLYTNLNQAAADLDSLLIDLKKNPKRYVNISVFGGGDKKKNK